MAISEEERDAWKKAADRAAERNTHAVHGALAGVQLTHEEESFIRRIAYDGGHEQLISILTKVKEHTRELGHQEMTRTMDRLRGRAQD